MANPLDIHYPHGQVDAVQMFIWDGTKPVLWDGTVIGSVGAASGVAIQDGVTSTTKASVVASGAKFGLVVCNPDGTPVAGGGSIPAGANIIGKVGIDQTTPGTTNGVQVNAALPAGANLIGGINGAEADDAAATKNPILAGAVAISSDGTAPGNVSTEGDIARLIATMERILYVNTYHPSTTSINFSGSSAYTNQSVVSAPGAGFAVVIDFVIASTGAATALNFYLDDTSGTKMLGPIYLEAVNGRGFASGTVRIRLAANTGLRLTSSVSINQSFTIGYHIEKL